MKPKHKNQSWATFDQIKGYEVEVQRLQAVAQALIASTDFDVFPKGIMFSGNPGTGKTTLAKAFIDATGFVCFSLDSCPTSLTLSKLYEKARKHVPSIVFLDDVDRMLATEGPDGYISDESRACLKELLARLDGVEDSTGIITVMTTNEYYSLDEALKRSGRVDLHIPIEKPNDSDREKILEFYMSQYPDFFPVEDKKLIESLAQKCHSLSCADLKLIVKDVYLLNYATAQNGTKLDFGEAFQAKIMELNGGGLLKRICKNESDIMRICYHEAGHALADWVFNGKASDICCLQTSDGNVGGWTSPRERDTETKFFCEEECMGEIATCMAGAAAEWVFMGSISVGITSDLDQAVQFAKVILGTCLSGDFKTMPCVLPTTKPFTDDDNQTEKYIEVIQEREHAIVEEAYKRSVALMKDYKEVIEEICPILKNNGMISAEKITEIFSGHNISKGGKQ